MTHKKLEKKLNQIILTEHLKKADLSKKRISQSQVLTLLDTSRNTLKKWRELGFLKRSKRNSEWVYNYSEIITMLNNNLVIKH